MFSFQPLDRLNLKSQEFNRRKKVARLNPHEVSPKSDHEVVTCFGTKPIGFLPTVLRGGTVVGVSPLKSTRVH